MGTHSEKLGARQPATAIDAGEHLLTADGDTIPITRLQPHTQQKGTAHNLTVTAPHTYHTLAGTTPILVHNTCGPKGRLSDPLPQGLSKHFVKAYEDIKAGKGIPQTNPATGQQKVFEGNAIHERQWAGALEYRVPGTKTTKPVS